MTLQGIDALNPPPSSAIKNAGKAFVVRYTKDCTAAELEADRAAGVLTVMVFESTGTDFSLGFPEGVLDAQLAQEQLAALGIPSAPVYFAIDQGTSDYSAVNAYLDGCASVLGLSRVGVYGDANVCTNARGHATYFWQTYAWSGGVAEGWVHLYQYLNGQTIDGYTVDLDKTVISDTEFGQVKYTEDDVLLIFEATVVAGEYKGQQAQFVSNGMFYRWIQNTTQLGDISQVVGPVFNKGPVQTWTPGQPVLDPGAFGTPADAVTAAMLGLPFGAFPQYTLSLSGTATAS